MKNEKNSWMNAISSYAENEKKKMTVSILLSVLSFNGALPPWPLMC